MLAEVLDHVTAAYPDAGIDVASYVDARSGLTVEVSVNSAGRYAPDGLGTRRAAAAAEAHARRSRSGLRLRCRPARRRRTAPGWWPPSACPAPAITIDEPAWSAVITAGRQPLPAVAPAGTNGNGWGPGTPQGQRLRADQPMPPDPPDYVPSTSSHVDELFGPMVDLPFQPTGESSQHPDLRGDRVGLVPGGAGAPPGPAGTATR